MRGGVHGKRKEGREDGGEEKEEVEEAVEQSESQRDHSPSSLGTPRLACPFRLMGRLGLAVPVSLRASTHMVHRTRGTLGRCMLNEGWMSLHKSYNSYVGATKPHK